jgi:hypothetical protein
MLRTLLKVAGIVSLPVAVFFMGCSKSTSPTGTIKPVTADNRAEKSNTADKGQGESTQAGDQDAEITAALATLSPEDRALAEKQRTCPVTGEVLGSMGAPVKLDVKGQPVFICCEGCRDKLLASPDEYLAKLNK